MTRSAFQKPSARIAIQGIAYMGQKICSHRSMLQSVTLAAL